MEVVVVWIRISVRQGISQRDTSGAESAPTQGPFRRMDETRNVTVKHFCDWLPYRQEAEDFSEGCWMSWRSKSCIEGSPSRCHGAKKESP